MKTILYELFPLSFIQKTAIFATIGFPHAKFLDFIPF